MGVMKRQIWSGSSVVGQPWSTGYKKIPYGLTRTIRTGNREATHAANEGQVIVVVAGAVRGAR